jgi:hypothetical protein
LLLTRAVSILAAIMSDDEQTQTNEWQQILADNASVIIYEGGMYTPLPTHPSFSFIVMAADAIQHVLDSHLASRSARSSWWS